MVTSNSELTPQKCRYFPGLSEAYLQHTYFCPVEGLKFIGLHYPICNQENKTTHCTSDSFHLVMQALFL